MKRSPHLAPQSSEARTPVRVLMGPIFTYWEMGRPTTHDLSYHAADADMTGGHQAEDHMDDDEEVNDEEPEQAQ